MSIEIRRAPVTAADGVTSELSIVAPAAPCSVLVFTCGLGIEAGYYEPFARALAEAGHAVALAEVRGVGSSSVRPSRSVDFGYRELVELELPAAIEAARACFEGVPLLVGGHSLGAQVSVLAGANLPPEVRGLVLVAGGAVWYRNWEGSMRRYVRLAGLLFPAVSSALGWFPGRLFGFGGEREARTLMHDWSSCASTGHYRLAGPGRDWDTAAVEQRRPTLGITIEGDEMAPPRSIAQLTAKMPHADVRLARVAPSRPGEGKAHFRWARAPQEVVAVIDGWIRGVVAAG
ncbi:MAG: alpha/beta fold hydrolase [Myxococcales bacterium]|nr:alpha/beta fold hydrolase [Myxococcales bacterium]